MTANDAVERDPTSFELWGTNDPITSADNSLGDEEDWTMITSGALNLSDDRFVAGDVISFSNSTAYTGYKVVIPTVKDPVAANSMQIADVNIWESSDGTGTPVFDFFDNVLASGVLRDETGESNYPAGEAPSFAIDGDTLTKYLNFGRENSGFIVTPSAGASVLNEFEMWTANDEIGRDPVGYEIYGTNDAITSEDNGRGMDESWTLIDSGDLVLPAERNELEGDDFSSGAVAVNNANGDSYTSYRFVVTSVFDEANSMQFSEIQFRGTADGGGGGNGDFNNDGAYDCTDINALTTEVAGEANPAGFDLTGDGVVDSQDVDAWLVEAGAENNANGGAFLRGDANLDGVVDVSDFNIWNGAKFTANSHWCSGDFNADGSVDVSDFNEWNGNKFNTSDSVTAIPEPGSLGMMLLAGLFGLRLVRRKR